MNKTLLAAAIICADQMIKHAVRRYPTGHVFVVFERLFRITHCTNTGAAFSILSGETLLLIGTSSLLLIGIAWLVFIKMHLTNAAQTACACLIGGGIGNLIDRIYLNGVTDYFELLFCSFPVFNLADVVITVSVFTLILLTMTGGLERITGE